MNTLTVEQLKELLQIQKEFDDRIPTLNYRIVRLRMLLSSLNGLTH